LREDAHDEGCQAELYGGGDDEVAAEGGVVDLGLLVLGLSGKKRKWKRYLEPDTEVVACDDIFLVYAQAVVSNCVCEGRKAIDEELCC
jgi:hypothetical protein